MPDGVRPDEPAPLAVMLHGAGSTGRAMVDLLGGPAGSAGFLLLCPESRGRTWDVIERGFGRDVPVVDAALAQVEAEWAVDGSRTVLGGFSDGASYALSLGIANGDRFSHLIAFSPGFMAPDVRRGRPPVYVSHGREDPVLPIDGCSRRIVPALRRLEYEVRFTEFDGGHGVPFEIARDALDWVLTLPQCVR